MDQVDQPELFYHLPFFLCQHLDAFDLLGCRHQRMEAAGKTLSPAGNFTGQKWNMQSARMRWFSQYNNALTVGADVAGLFMVPFLLFRAWHPPLFVPWSEITGVRETRFLFVRFVEMRLGRVEEIPFRIRASLAARIRIAAGSEWPDNYTRALIQPPPPIG
jgi:hypothetical protein